MSTLYKRMAGALTVLAIALLVPVSGASANYTTDQPHRLLSDISATISRPAPSADQTYEFTLINQSSRTVYVAYGKYRPYDGGELAPPSAWVASGWWRVAPGTSKTIYRSNTDDHIYFRMENNSGTIVPRNYEDSADFCTSSSKFTSTELEQQSPGNRYNFRISTNDGNTYGATCEEAGGQWETFYKMRVHTNFTVH